MTRYRVQFRWAVLKRTVEEKTKSVISTVEGKLLTINFNKCVPNPATEAKVINRQRLRERLPEPTTQDIVSIREAVYRFRANRSKQSNYSRHKNGKKI